MEGITTKDSPYIRVCPRCGINLTLECSTCPCCGMDVNDVHMFPASQQGLSLMMEEGKQLLAEERFTAKEVIPEAVNDEPAGLSGTGPQEGPDTAAPAVHFCYNCGAKVHPGAKFCSSCSTKLD